MRFYARYRMFMYVFPSSEYVGDHEKNEMLWNLETPISYDLIQEHYEDIQDYIKTKKQNKKSALFSNLKQADFEIGFD